jgi:hypothetical protein
MRKRQISTTPPSAPPSSQAWLDVEHIALVEVTSEENGYPILVFEDKENTRTQEFVLRWSPDAGKSFREIVRQQWNFSSPGSVREIEDCAVELSAVTVLELIIVPDMSGGAARASLASLRFA